MSGAIGTAPIARPRRSGAIISIAPIVPPHRARDVILYKKLIQIKNTQYPMKYCVF